MNGRRVHRAPLLVLASVLAATACDASPKPCRSPYCAYGLGSDTSPVEPLPLCRESAPPDYVSSDPIPITRAELSSTVGNNIDRINNAPRGGVGGGLGRTIPGCDLFDLPGGEDAEFANAVVALGTLFGPIGPVEIRDSATGDVLASELRWYELVEPDPASEGCFKLEFRFGALDEATIVTGVGSTFGANHEFPIPGNVDLVLHPTPAASSCEGPCTDATIRLRVAVPTANLRVDEAESNLVARSFVSGAIFYADDADPDETRNATGLRSELERYADAAHLTTVAREALITTFEEHLDLHQDVEGQIRPCTAPGGNAALIDANTISIAIELF